MTIWPAPGTIVYVLFLGILRHKGIVSNRWWSGKPMVIANSWNTHGVAEVTWDHFAAGQPCYVEGYPSDLSPLEVLYNARRMIGQPYNVAFSNCEHFVYACHGQQPASPQVTAVVLIGVVGLLAAATRP
jgi:hypothetical protein